MSVRVRDLFPFGDVDESVALRMGERFPDLPVEHVAGALDLGRSVVSMMEVLPRPLEDAGLTPARWRLLIALTGQTDTGEATIGELAARLGVREPTVTSTVDRAERDGLVSRRRGEQDRRVVVVELTEAGARCVARLLPIVAGRLARLVEALGGPAAAREMSTRITHATSAADAAP